MHSLSTLKKLNGPEPEALEVVERHVCPSDGFDKAYPASACEFCLADENATLKHDLAEASAWCDAHREEADCLLEMLGFAQACINVLSLPNLTPDQRKAAVKVWTERCIKAAVRASSPNEAARLRFALEELVTLQAHYAKLLNEYDGGARTEFTSADQWLARLDELARQRDRAVETLAALGKAPERWYPAYAREHFNKPVGGKGGA
jgi:hypothetical protein